LNNNEENSQNKNHRPTDRQIEDFKQKCMESEKMAVLGQLLAGVAHEVNTPLAAINSNINLFYRLVEKLKESVLKEPSAKKDPKLISIFEHLDKLNSVNEEAIGRIVSIVNSLRIFARHDKNEMEEVDIQEGLKNTLTILHHDFKNRIEVKTQFEKLPKIQCYPNQINQVFMNILVNAGQAIEDKGEIFVKTSKDKNNILIEIKDSGKGISDNNSNCIFQPGFTTKEVGVGTGLGLSIVKKIIDDHKGKIVVKSKIGEGTVFQIYLPISIEN
jgi:two-component system, NtrC family, sensor kinase